MADKNQNEKPQDSSSDQRLHNQLEHATGEIADSEMEAVSGGAIYMKVDGFTEDGRNPRVKAE